MSVSLSPDATHHRRLSVRASRAGGKLPLGYGLLIGAAASVALWAGAAALISTLFF